MLVSRGRIMVLPVILSFFGSSIANGIGGIFGMFRGRGKIQDDDDYETAKTDLRLRAQSLKQKYDPLGDDPEAGFSSQSAKPRVSPDRFTSQSANRAPRPPSTSSGSGGTSSTLPPPRANLTRRPSTDIARKRPSVDDDFDSLQTPSLRDRRGTRRRQNSNDYDDEVMGGVFDEDDDDGLI
ncbi:MAG: hypothetical protein SFZ02_14980 [bacterium]|nr:hypothetical protein [bacterium]